MNNFESSSVKFPSWMNNQNVYGGKLDELKSSPYMRVSSNGDSETILENIKELLPFKNYFGTVKSESSLFGRVKKMVKEPSKIKLIVVASSALAAIAIIFWSIRGINAEFQTSKESNKEIFILDNIETRITKVFEAPPTKNVDPFDYLEVLNNAITLHITGKDEGKLEDYLTQISEKCPQTPEGIIITNHAKDILSKLKNDEKLTYFNGLGEESVKDIVKLDQMEQLLLNKNEIVNFLNSLSIESNKKNVILKNKDKWTYELHQAAADTLKYGEDKKEVNREFFKVLMSHQEFELAEKLAIEAKDAEIVVSFAQHLYEELAYEKSISMLSHIQEHYRNKDTLIIKIAKETKDKTIQDNAIKGIKSDSETNTLIFQLVNSLLKSHPDGYKERALELAKLSRNCINQDFLVNKIEKHWASNAKL